MPPRRGPARARVRQRRPALLPRVPLPLAGPAVLTWARSAAHRRAVSGPRRPPVRGRELLPGGGAPLCGGASYEAEGRCGARGGGAGRVGPPTGWPRLRLLRQIGDQLVPGVEQFLLVDDVVAVEDGAALVSGQEHGDPLGDVCADQVARGGAAAVVKEAGRHGVGARMRAGLRASNRRARHLPMRYETGLPSSVIRFRTLHARTASRRCPDELRARRQSPTIDLYRKNAFSTRAC